MSGPHSRKEECCCGLTASPPNSFVGTLTPRVMGPLGGAEVMELSLVRDVSPFKEATAISLAPSNTQGAPRGGLNPRCEPGRVLPEGLGLGLPASRIVGNTFLLFISYTVDCIFVTTARTD